MRPRIKSPLLLIVFLIAVTSATADAEQGGDTDVVRPEHAVALTRLLPHAQLAILPGTDHAIMITRTDRLVPMVEAFLNARMPAG